VFLDQANGVFAADRLCDNLDIVALFQDTAQALPDDVVVVNDEYLDLPSAISAPFRDGNGHRHPGAPCLFAPHMEHSSHLLRAFLYASHPKARAGGVRIYPHAIVADGQG